MNEGKASDETVSTKREMDWAKVLFYIYVHVLAVVGLFEIVTEAYLRTTLFSIFLIVLAVLGITAGSHRLWAHRSYEAVPGLRVFLMLCQTLAGQGTVYDWVLSHRLHHKYFSTEKDPFNPSRGFFYTHIQCLIRKPHPMQEKLEEEIDMSDLEEDKVVMFQKKFYWILFIIIGIILPLNAPLEYWNESLKCSFFVAGFFRYAVTLNIAWLVHSGSRLWGLQRDEKNPPDSNLVFIITKSYWPQYHYMAPWDYRTTEFGSYAKGCTTAFIRIFAALGWASNLRTIDCEGVRKALILSVETGKDVPQALNEVANNNPVPEEHFLEPKKYL